MNIQSVILNLAIKKGNLDLLHTDLTRYYFDTYSRIILAQVYGLIRDKNAITRDSVINKVKSLEIKDVFKATTLTKLDELLRTDIVQPPDIINELKKEAQDNIFNSTLTSLMDKHSTAQSKCEAFYDTYKRLNELYDTDKVISYKDAVDQIIKDADSGNESTLLQKALEVNDYQLETIFGKRIYPQIYLITGRPNDCKTRLIHNLIVHLNKSYKGRLYSFEDSVNITAAKLMAIRLKKPVLDILKANIDTDIMRATGYQHTNLYISRTLMTSQQLSIDIDNMMRMYDLQYIAIDYIQQIMANKGQSIYEKMSDFSNTILKINERYDIPIFLMSQVDKESQQGTGLLGIGSAKGAGEISEHARNGMSVNPGEFDNQKIVHSFKTSLSQKKNLTVIFDAESGYIKNVQDMEDQ